MSQHEEHLYPGNPNPTTRCGCLSEPYQMLVDRKYLGMDAYFASVALLTCRLCGHPWLEYHYELEAFTASGRWYLGRLSPQQAERISAADAKAALESLDWYFYGGSYYQGRSGRAVGKINLNP